MRIYPNPGIGRCYHIKTKKFPKKYKSLVILFENTLPNVVDIGFKLN